VALGEEMNLQMAKKLSDSKVEFIEKKKIYEVTNISNLISLRCTKEGGVLVYTIYQDSLKQDQFVTLLKYIKTHMIDQGYSVDRIPHNRTDCYIFLFSWEKTVDDILSESVEETMVSGPV